jgi:ring-1,2-phenylacetyl-CoA epoxidase subunit PaaE
MKTYFLQVKEVKKETEDTVTLSFWHPISEQIKYKAGQFITISVPGPDGKKVKRSYSMSSSPATDTAVAVTVKRVPDGVVSNYLNEKVHTGDFLEVIEPMGNFLFEPEENPARNIFLFGAGSGITPLISIAKTVLKTEGNTKVKLFYGNRSEDSIIFKKELEELEIQYRGRFAVQNILSQPQGIWVGEKGRINQANATLWLKDACADFVKDHFYMCGPEEMMDELKKIFELYNTPKNHVYFERFNAPMQEEDTVNADELKKQTVKVLYDGDTYEFDVEPHQTILEAALELDIDLPYSCQAGMCTACLGKCTQGKIKMDEEEGLTEKEIAEGYVLTCVSHPMTEGVVLEIE